MDGTEVGAVGQQVGGKTMADDMGVTFLDIPASTARCFIILSMERGVRREGGATLTNNASSVSALLSK